MRKKDLAAVRAQLTDYANLRKLVEQWVDLAEELAILTLEQDRSE